MLEPIALDAIVGYYLGPKIKQDMKRMCEHTNGGSGILTSIGWVDLKTKRSQKLTAMGANLLQSTVHVFQFWAEKTELQASSDGSRLMGEPPYHLRKTRMCASTWIFATKIHPCFPLAHGIWGSKPVHILVLGVRRRENLREKENCMLS